MEKAGVEAHSGYITVQNRSHMFFLFLKAPENITNAPLILWLQGGPGKSGLFGQFLENGPLGIDAQGELYNRSCSFQSFSNVLYVDYPAGGGFSVIENASVLSRSLMNVTNDLHSFLEQFYMLFQETYSLPLYIAGESYGARAAISLAQQLRTHITQAQKEEGCQNDQQKWKTHPLRGVILLSGFYVPLSDSVLKSEKYLYQLGMVDSQGRDQLAHNFELIRNLSQKNTTAALLLLAQTAMNMNVGRTKSLFSNLTGYSHQGSVLHPSFPQEVGRYINYVNMTKFKEALHIWPNTTLDRYRLALSFMLAPNDFFNDVTPILTSVLDSEKVLMINGQMDDVFPPLPEPEVQDLLAGVDVRLQLLEPSLHQ
ncbi:venom serine carboxypeptidase-like [Haemaphysalis longicornis]